MIDRIDHVVAPVPDLAFAATAYERLGFNLTPATRHTGLGTENRVFFVGGRPSQSFYVELLGIHDRDEARAASRTLYLDVADRGGGVARIMLSTDAIAP